MADITGMHYHDNKMSFEGKRETLHSGTFTIEDFSITSGQDPDNYSTTGHVIQLNGNEFNFVVGRKGSSGPADFFNRKIGPTENTFNHKADKLNFAFFGTMELTVSGGYLDSKTTLEFPNTCLAQGHSGSTNNWWFGIVGGKYTATDVEFLSAKDASGEWVVRFFRGEGTSVDSVRYEVQPQRQGISKNSV